MSNNNKIDSHDSWLACQVIFQQFGRANDKLEALVYKWIQVNDINFNRNDIADHICDVIDWNRLQGKYRVVVIQHPDDYVSGYGEVIEKEYSTLGCIGWQKVEYWADTLQEARGYDELAYGGAWIYRGNKSWTLAKNGWKYNNGVTK
mgnify:CR=1 FL=1|tara:strand:- start:96 stop:536 length:441 start_codon:yes stop_codon:yes gene_type:complete